MWRSPAHPTWASVGGKTAPRQRGLMSRPVGGRTALRQRGLPAHPTWAGVGGKLPCDSEVGRTDVTRNNHIAIWQGKQPIPFSSLVRLAGVEPVERNAHNGNQNTECRYTGVGIENYPIVARSAPPLRGLASSDDTGSRCSGVGEQKHPLVAKGAPRSRGLASSGNHPGSGNPPDCSEIDTDSDATPRGDENQQLQPTIDADMWNDFGLVVYHQKTLGGASDAQPGGDPTERFGSHSSATDNNSGIYHVPLALGIGDAEGVRAPAGSVIGDTAGVLCGANLVPVAAGIGAAGGWAISTFSTTSRKLSMYLRCRSLAALEG